MKQPLKILLSVLLLGLFSSTFYFLGKHQASIDAVKPGEPSEYAVFSGGKISANEVLATAKMDVEAEKREVYETKKRVTLEMIKQRLLEAEAKKRNLTANELMDQIRKEHENDPVSDKELSDYTRTQGKNEKSLSKAERDGLIKVLRSTKILRYQNEFVEKLLKEADVKLEIPAM